MRESLEVYLDMQLKERGNTGVMVPEVGLGTARYTGGVEPLRRGVELGAFLIDTAEMYRTEDAVGQAVKGIRDRVFIATKVLGSHLRYDQVMRAAENSLRQLGTDYIDLYQIHWPNSSVSIKETVRAMEALADSGQVKYIGVSNFSVKELEEARAAMTRYPIVSNQVLYNLKHREIEKNLLPYCQQNHVTVIAYPPLADGSLTARTQALQEVADEVDKTPAQVALNWCISHSNVIVIPKSNSLARIEENCGASGWCLSEDQLRRLDEAFPV